MNKAAEPGAVDNPKSVARRDYVKLEKNLTELGFFTATSKRRLAAKEKRTVLIREDANGKRVEMRARILPSAIYGLPVTSDQDKFLALMKLVTDQRRRTGTIRNPVGFTTAELMAVLGKRNIPGFYYKEVEDWLMRMTSTTISSEGIVYLAGRKSWANDTFHVFERAVTMGKELPEGGVADKHYIWLSEWQLENINSQFLLSVDLEQYSKLRNYIGRTLVPVLQIWLYASRHEGYYSKRYDEFCQHLNIKQYRHISQIKQVLSPSLDELVQYGYLSKWDVVPLRTEDGYKVCLWHGERFGSERARPERQLPAPEACADGNGGGGTGVLEALLARGIAAATARRLAQGADETVLDQLEWGDWLVGQSGGKVFNPPGFYVYLIRNKVMPPAGFETSRMKERKAAAREARDREYGRRLELEAAYREYREKEIARFIRENYPSGYLRQETERKKKELLKSQKSAALWPPKTLEEVADNAVRGEIARHVTLESFEAFCARVDGQLELGL